METASIVVFIIITFLILHCLHESKRIEHDEQSANVNVKTTIEEGQGELEDNLPPSNVDWKSTEGAKQCISSVHRKIGSEEYVTESNVVVTERIVKIQTEEPPFEPQSPENSSQLLKAGFKNKEEKQPPTVLQHKIENEKIDGPNAEEDYKASCRTKVKIERENDESGLESPEISSKVRSTDSKAQGVKYVSTLHHNIGNEAEVVAPNKIESRSARAIQITSCKFAKKENDEMVPLTLMRHGRTASGTKMKLAAEEQQSGLLIPEGSPPSLNIDWRDNQEKQDAKHIFPLHHKIRSMEKYEIVAPYEVVRNKVASRLARVIQLTSVSQRVGAARSQWSPATEDGSTADASDAETMNIRRKGMLIQETDAYKFFEKLEKDFLSRSDKKKLDGKKLGQ